MREQKKQNKFNPRPPAMETLYEIFWVVWSLGLLGLHITIDNQEPTKHESQLPPPPQILTIHTNHNVCHWLVVSFVLFIHPSYRNIYFAKRQKSSKHHHGAHISESNYNSRLFTKLFPFFFPFHFE